MGSNIMGSYEMKSARLHTKGFTLIASLLLLLLLSGIAIGLMMMVNTEGKVGGTDLQNNAAYHSAEGGIEKMASDLAGTFQNAQAPTAQQICDLGAPALQPTQAGVTWKDYTVVPGPLGSACPTTLTGLAKWGQITGSGQDAGLWAQIIPVNMLATAALPGGQEVSMTRSAQVALIPVFQFGVFCDNDCGFFNSPDLDFAGRVHANGDLYLGVASGHTLTFHDKLEAYGNVVTTVLPNGLSASAYSDTGTVLVPQAAQGCDGNPPYPACGTFTQSNGSVLGAGGNPPQSAQNPTWQTTSLSTYHSEIIDGDYGLTPTVKYGTGAKKLSLPFVNGTNFPFEVIRRPQGSDSIALTQSREYNMAQIRVLLSDTPAELPGGAADVVNNIRLANVGPYQNGVPTSYPAVGTPWGLAAPVPATNTYNTYFATALNGYSPDMTSCGGNPCPANACTSGAFTYSCLPADWPLAPDTLPAAVAVQTNLSPANLPLIYQDATAGDKPTTFALCPPTGNVNATIPVANIPPGCPTAAAPTAPYMAALTPPTQSWNLIDGWLRVEYKDVNGNWNPVTNEWLKLGFARDLRPPTANFLGAPAGGTFSNDVNPQAILLLQQPADRNGDGGIDKNGTAPVCTATNIAKVCTSWKNARPPDVQVDAATNNPFFGEDDSTQTPLAATTPTTYAIGQAVPATKQSITMNNWYPINFYDAREGEARDTDQGNNSCTTAGVMNAVEIDVGNLKLWLKGQIGTTGTNVDYVAQNGYVLYFSDRRGMLYNPNAAAQTKTGDSGLEDVINAASAAGTPDGVLETPGGAKSPEDVNQNGILDNWGTQNLGSGQWNGSLNLATNLFTKTAGGSQNAQIYAAVPDNPYTPRINSCSSTARKNWVSGARHVLKLVDGSLGNLPLSPVGTAADPGGFTVSSENPVYIQGDYNSNKNDNFWPNGKQTGVPDIIGHASTAVIADAVTMLSNNWNDLASMVSADVTQATTRPAVTTYYRVAIAGGKNKAFPFPNWENSTDYGFGTDGGIHNFLRFLEDWQNPGATLNYGGSLVSLYYATYNTGVFKCCTYSVYQPPIRNYIFDADFTLPQGLPPGTPMFKDVESLGYRQLFAARKN